MNEEIHVSPGGKVYSATNFGVWFSQGVYHFVRKYTFHLYFQLINIMLLTKKLYLYPCRLGLCVAVWLVSPNGSGCWHFPLVQISRQVLCVDEKAGGETGGEEFW